MSRNAFDQNACDQLAERVREIEASTDVEVVIAVHARSTSYQHADYLAGFLLSFATLLFMLFSSRVFGPLLVAINVPVFFAIGVYVCAHSDGLRRRLTSKKFRADAVRRGAAAMFYEAGIANTSNEMGMLIYLSLLERRIEVLADRGVLKAVPPLPWNEILFEMKQAGRRANLKALLDALERLGELLAEHAPATGENPNELPDMPIVIRG